MIFLLFRKEFVSSLEGRLIDWFEEILLTQLSFGESMFLSISFYQISFPEALRFLAHWTSNDEQGVFFPISETQGI